MKQSSFVPLHGEGRQLIHKGGGEEEREEGDDEKFLRNFWDGVIFNLVSKVNRYYFGFPFLHFVIGPQNSHHSLNQSDAKLKTIATLSFAFSRASGSLLVSTWSPHWLLMT